MLSLGGSRAGLPSHVHGETRFALARSRRPRRGVKLAPSRPLSETWLAVVHGAKRWFVYPPGRARRRARFARRVPPAQVGVRVVRRRVRPRAPRTPRARATSARRARGGGAGAGAGAGHLPLECVQRAGETLYLPSGWKHATLNIGETIGVGGQSAYEARARLAQATRALERDDADDVEAHHGAGLGYAHEAMAREPFDAALLERAAAHFARASALRPLQPELCLLRGEVLHALGNARAMRAAVDECEARFGDGAAAADALPNATLAAVRLKFGRFYLQSGEPRAAIAARRDALARPRRVRTRRSRTSRARTSCSRARARDEHFATAERALAAALELNPRDEQVRAQLEQLRASAAPSPPPKKKKKKRKP